MKMFSLKIKMTEKQSHHSWHFNFK